MKGVEKRPKNLLPQKLPQISVNHNKKQKQYYYLLQIVQKFEKKVCFAFRDALSSDLLYV